MTPASRWMGRVAALGCLTCRNSGRGATPAQVHHLTGYPFRGIGQKAADAFVVPLCPSCHADLHRGVESWERANGKQVDLLAQTILELARLA